MNQVPKSHTTGNRQSRFFPIIIKILALIFLLSQWLVAQWSLRQENPTIDEVLHLPAGVSYWQTGSFRLYHHNPPLVKLMAAWPVLNEVNDKAKSSLYNSTYWTQNPPNKAGFGHDFAQLLAPRYFELFTHARSIIPTFLTLGGLFVFLWSRSIYGNIGALISLALWCTCPNMLAHGRLITTDVASSALGTAATFFFVLYLRFPSNKTALVSGIALGIGLLTKFSLIVLVGLWPVIWLIQLILVIPNPQKRATIKKTLPHIAIVTMASLLVVNLGYGFEGTGRKLGQFEFYSQSLTRELPANRLRLHQTGNAMLDILGSHRVNRFRGGLLQHLPCPLPAEFILGFDDQKVDAEGIPARYLNTEKSSTTDDSVEGYPVYLNGEIRGSGWWYYYPYAFLIKTPPGTLFLIFMSLLALVLMRRNAQEWFEESATLVVPVSMILIMTFLTDINIGLRYILPALPCLYVGAGRLAPLIGKIANPKLRHSAIGAVVLCLISSAWSTAGVAPHFLAYFNFAGGGAENGSEHLIDSNLDWGQDLVNLKNWLDKNAPSEPVGIAYFGQINPDIFRLRGSGFDWYLPPARSGTIKQPPPGRASAALQPGLYAVSASLAHGLPWRVYDSYRWAPYQADQGAFDYFLKAQPIAKVGWSIFIYRLDAQQAQELEQERLKPARSIN